MTVRELLEQYGITRRSVCINGDWHDLVLLRIESFDETGRAEHGKVMFLPDDDTEVELGYGEHDNLFITAYLPRVVTRDHV